MSTYESQKGFTLIEIIVAVSIFVVVMVIAIGAVLNAVDANRKAQNINVIVNNLNLAVESMVRDLRTGNDYNPCDISLSDSHRCVEFTDKDGNQNVSYFITENGGSLVLTKGNTPNGAGAITSEEVTISDFGLTFKGLGNVDGPQRILLHMKGEVGGGKTKAKFSIETVITSRVLDVAELNNP